MLPRVTVLCVLFGLTVAGRLRGLDLRSNFKNDIDDNDLILDNISPDFLPSESHREPSVYQQVKFVGDEFILSHLAGQKREVRVFSNGILGLETHLPELGENGLHIRQMSDGKKLLKLIFTDAQTMAGCDIDRSRLDVGDFVSRFFAAPIEKVSTLKGDKETLQVDSQYILNNLNSESRSLNATLHKVPASSRPLSGLFASVVAFDTMNDECRRLHYRIERERGGNQAYSAQEDEQEYLTNYRRYFDEDRRYYGSTKRDVEAEGQAKSRMKRGWLIVSGTKWCGNGNEAAHENDLGDKRRTDMCCRSHDNDCKKYIEGFTTRYNLYNWRFYTVSHCECDNKFRNCLNQVGSATAEWVRWLFFDFIGPRCFNLEKQWVCVKSGWWGSCLKHEWQSVAVIV